MGAPQFGQGGRPGSIHREFNRGMPGIVLSPRDRWEHDVAQSPPAQNSRWALALARNFTSTQLQMTSRAHKPRGMRRDKLSAAGSRRRAVPTSVEQDRVEVKQCAKRAMLATGPASNQQLTVAAAQRAGLFVALQACQKMRPAADA
jgi:hypothetical protein